MTVQEQFLNVIDRDEAEARFRSALILEPLGVEEIALADALGRVLARDVVARIDVPSFDRSNLDGFAVRTADTFGASELEPRTVKLLPPRLEAGTTADVEVRPGDAVQIATGGMLPRGADAILMVEHADRRGGELLVQKAVTPGFGVTFAGTDVATGETVLRGGTLLTSRETGVLAAIGATSVAVWRRPWVAIISTGNELIAPGEPMSPPHVYDSNAQILADFVRELGGEPRCLGIVRDNADELRAKLHSALAESDVVLLSGGTSKGEGDLCYRVVGELTDPGIVAHGVALKPGKPICLAVSGGKPVVVLPGFPTSAIFTFHEFIAPVILILAGRRNEARDVIPARMAVKVNSEVGRTEYVLVNLVEVVSRQPSAVSLQSPVPTRPLVAYPMGKGSGSVTTFSRADGFVTIGRHTEIVEAGEPVHVHPLSTSLQLADLVAIGSHCIGLDYLLSQLQQRGITSKLITVGSTAGLEAVRRGECDLAGVHLLDSRTGEYNRPFLTEDMLLVKGYGRSQGIVFRRGDARFEGRNIDQLIPVVTNDADCVMVNRNQGSGTRILLDRLLAGARPPGYAVQPTTHNAVAAAVAQGRADWGMAIQTVASAYDLGFIPYQDERYDFIIPKTRRHRPAVEAFVGLLNEPTTRTHLAELGFNLAVS